MKLTALAPRDRRALTVGAMALAPMLLFALVLRPYVHTLAASRERAATQRELLVRELAALRTTTAARAVTTRGAVLLDSAGTHLLDGDDWLSASAALAAYVRTLANESGLHLASTETAGADLGDVRLEVRADGDLAAIVDFLRATESGELLVAIDRIGIDRHGPESDGARGGGLTLTATLHGYPRARYASVTGGRP